jgi:hypothetical protein
MQGIAWVFFMLMALVLVFIYLAIRREWLAPGLTAGGGVVLTIVLMVLTALGQGNGALQAIVVGIVVGGIFSGSTVGIAWYFQNQDLQRRYGQDAYYEPKDKAV